MTSAAIVTEREKYLRRKLPGLHVGRTLSGVWHVLDARCGLPLCGVAIRAVEEDGPLESASPGRLCRRCSRIQGDEYGEW